MYKDNGKNSNIGLLLTNLKVAELSLIRLSLALLQIKFEIWEEPHRILLYSAEEKKSGNKSKDNLGEQRRENREEPHRIFHCFIVKRTWENRKERRVGLMLTKKVRRIRCTPPLWEERKFFLWQERKSARDLYGKRGSVQLFIGRRGSVQFVYWKKRKREIILWEEEF